MYDVQSIRMHYLLRVETDRAKNSSNNVWKLVKLSCHCFFDWMSSRRQYEYFILRYVLLQPWLAEILASPFYRVDEPREYLLLYLSTLFTNYHDEWPWHLYRNTVLYISMQSASSDSTVLFRGVERGAGAKPPPEMREWGPAAPQPTEPSTILNTVSI